jgi:hypothetical protein
MCKDENTLPRGANVSRYRILEAIGAGGMGIVYAAHDPELDRNVAIKLLRPRESEDDGTLRARIVREARAMARLSHPNVVAVYDVGTVGTQIFVAMELVEGKTLSGWLSEAKRSWRAILDVFAAAGRGLAAAHAAGLVHRDFKPDNVLIGADGSVRVTDFGLALPTGTPSGEPDSKRFGTPPYMSPEQLQGAAVDARADLFSFCVALHEALYRQRPYAGDSREEIECAVLESRLREPPRTARVPPRIRRILRRGLSTRPEERYGSMGELLHTLRRNPAARGRLGLASLLSFALVAVGAAVAGVGERHLVCSGAERKLEGVWDGARKREVRAAFVASGRPSAEEAWRATERSLDEYARRFVGMHTEACEATRMRKQQSEELLDLRMHCLAGRRAGLSQLVALLARADGPLVERAVEAAHRLSPIEGCGDIDSLRSGIRRLPRRGGTARRRVLARALVAGR